MSRVESGFVPLPKVEQEQPESKTFYHLNLPDYVDQDRIGVNLTEVEKLKGLGGIELLLVVGNTDLETSSESHEIHGINSDGSASASKKVSKTVIPVFDSDSLQLDTFSMENRPRVSVTQLNVSEISQRVREDGGNIRETKSWVSEIDEGIKGGIRKEGHQNLLHDPKGNDKFIFTIYGVTIASDAYDYINTGDIGVSMAAIYYALNRSINLLYSRIDPYERFSFVPGFQLDRAAILSIQSRLKHVVKDLHEEKDS